MDRASLKSNLQAAQRKTMQSFISKNDLSSWAHLEVPILSFKLIIWHKLYGQLFAQGKRKIGNKDFGILGHLEIENKNTALMRSSPNQRWHRFCRKLNVSGCIELKKANHFVTLFLADGYTSIVPYKKYCLHFLLSYLQAAKSFEGVYKRVLAIKINVFFCLAQLI